MLIDLEGLDGSGKTTQAELLCRRLDKKGIACRKIKLPDYGSDSSALVRMYLAGEFGSSADDVNAYAASSFYAVDRYASYNTDWKAEYLSGKLIFADRYTPANAVYQMTKLPREQWDYYLSWLSDFEYEKLCVPKPDLVLFLDMPVAVSQKLMSSRYNGDESRKDVHECDVRFLNECREAALYAAERCGWKLVPCSDGEQPYSVEKINDVIFEAVCGALGI